MQLKTATETKFEILITEVFTPVLKPLGYRKKANNFYKSLNGIGKIINIQKNKYSSKDHISFTINTGIFSPEYWNVTYNYFNKPIPNYPTEPDCILRRRIGNLLNTGDIWYEINAETDIGALKTEQSRNLLTVILPYFESINSNEDILNELDKGTALTVAPITKLILLGELNMLEEAQFEYRKLLEETHNSHFQSTIKEFGRKYHLHL
jgi:hypothetical protein